MYMIICLCLILDVKENELSWYKVEENWWGGFLPCVIKLIMNVILLTELSLFYGRKRKEIRRKKMQRRK